MGGQEFSKSSHHFQSSYNLQNASDWQEFVWLFQRFPLTMNGSGQTTAANVPTQSLLNAFPWNWKLICWMNVSSREKEELQFSEEQRRASKTEWSSTSVAFFTQLWICFFGSFTVISLSSLVDFHLLSLFLCVVSVQVTNPHTRTVTHSSSQTSQLSHTLNHFVSEQKNREMICGGSEKKTR